MPCLALYMLVGVYVETAVIYRVRPYIPALHLIFWNSGFTNMQ